MNRKLPKLSLVMGAFLSTLFLIPTSLAANPLITNVTVAPTPFFFDVPGANPAASLTVQYHLETGGYPTVKVKEFIKDDQGNVVYDEGMAGADDHAAGDYHMNWDGKFKNSTIGTEDQFVPNGNYTVYLSAESTSPPAAIYNSNSFAVKKTIGPAVTINGSAPTMFYTTGSNQFEIKYNLSAGSGTTNIVRLKIDGPAGNSSKEAVVANTKNGDASASIVWDGKINGTSAAAGQYTYSLDSTASVNGYSVASLPLTGTFTVSNSATPSPTLTNLSATPTTFNPNKESVVFGYSLGNSTGQANIAAAIMLSSDPLMQTVKSWNFPNQGNGNFNMTWDGKDADGKILADGQYTLKMTGTDGSITVPEASINFTLNTKPDPSQSLFCAGFTDVIKTDKLCAAIQYVKDAGIFAGYPDGTFAPSKVINRAETSKVVLLGFKKNILAADGTNSGFSDAKPGEWYMPYLRTAKEDSIIKGYVDGTFRPDQQIIRVELLKIFFLASGKDLSSVAVATAPYPDTSLDSGSEWYIKYVEFVKEHALVDAAPNGDFYPTQGMTRGDVAELFYRYHQANL